ncbi:MAG: hypothetical protein H6699_12375 [Myxococcales bacterium]|nr:hypothetical protein [Myxococcales bacterium]
MRWSSALAVAVALGLAPGAIRAQARDPGAESDEALSADGWEFDEERATPGHLGAGFLALSLGPVWTGVGHWSAGERETARRLTLAQATSGAGLAAGLLLRGAGSRNEAAREAGGALAAAAASAYVAAWFADVVGAFKGTGVRLPPNTHELPGVSAEVYFTALAARGLPVTSLGVVRVPIVSTRWTVLPFVEAGFDLNYRRIGVGGGYRAPVGHLGVSYVQVGASGFDEHEASGGTGRTQVAADTVLLLDAGDLVAALRGLQWRLSTSAALDYAFFDAFGHRFEGDQRTFTLPVETELGFDANVGVYVGLGYAHRHDSLAGSITPALGVLSGRLGIVPRGRVGVDLRVEQGAFTRVWAGLQLALVGAR